MHDESATDRLRQRILELEREGRASESARRATLEFMARTTHEVRNFLNTILGFVDLLRDTELGTEQRVAVEAIERGGRQLSALASDLLNLAKADVGPRESHRVAFDLVDLVEDTVRAAAVWGRGKTLDIRSRIAAGVPQRVFGDPQRLRQVLTNLLQNAVKFTDAGLVVSSVDRAATGAAVEFAVSDTGVGIAADRLDSIFEPFAQAHVPGGSASVGSGLGLAISKRLVEHMGGTIRAASALGGGTTIRFAVELEAAPDEDGLRANNRLGGLDVLVVDDSNERAELRELLRNWGADVTEIDDGRSALEELRSGRGGRHAVILLAGRMRGMSGMAIVHQLGEDRALLSKIVMLLPVDHRRGDMAALAELGVGATVLRPLRRSELLHAIERTITPFEGAPQSA